MQNLPLPQLPVQEMFYLRKLWFYVLSVHNLKTNESMFYTYQEGSGKKGPNEVCTLILKYTQTKITDEVKELYIFSDVCGGKQEPYVGKDVTCTNNDWQVLKNKPLLPSTRP